MNLEKQSYRPPLWTIPLVLVGVFVIAAKLLNTSPPTNRAQTTPDHEDETLRSRFYNVPLTRSISAAQEVLRAQRTYGRAWKIAGYDSSQGERQQIHAEVPVLVFTDDFTVVLSHESDGFTRVDCQSVARLGEGDFGENRRHIAQFLTALDAALKR